MKYPLTWWLPEGLDFGDTAYAATPRVGSTSMHHYFRLMKYSQVATDVEARARPNRVVFVREPIERLLSAFAYLTRTGLVDNNWPAFVDMVLSKGDWLTAPQTQVHDGVPNVFRKLEDINTVLPFIGHKNSRKGVQISQWDYRLGELKEHYAEDTELWKSL